MRTSVFHGAENCSQLRRSTGAIVGRTPAAITTRSGSTSSINGRSTAGSVASSGRASAAPRPARRFASRPTAQTRAPVASRAVVVARPTPLPAPMTIAFFGLGDMRTSVVGEGDEQGGRDDADRVLDAVQPVRGDPGEAADAPLI